MKDVILNSKEGLYMMEKIANKMQSPRKEIGALEVNLEHIFPLNPAPEWGNCDELKLLQWNIGNLMVINDNLNNDCENFIFSVKLKEYKKSDLVMVKNVVEHYSDWNTAAVLKRASYLGEHVDEVWNFKNMSRV